MFMTIDRFEGPLSVLRRVTCSLLLIASFCAAAASSGEETVWKGVDEFVKLLPQDAPASPNQHPVSLRPADLAAALGNIRLRKGEETGSLMDKKDAQRLAPHLAGALSRASPGQDVIFSVSIRVKAPIIGSSEVTIAGRAFHSEGKLHLIVGDLWRSAVSPDYHHSPVARREIDRRLYPHTPGMRAKETVHEGLSFETGPGIQLFALNGRVRQDWLVLDVATSATPTVRTQDEAASAPGRDRVTPAAEKATTAEERLSRLKRLHGQGLITDEEYARKRKEIIDQL